jgi:hypothetical protein
MTHHTTYLSYAREDLMPATWLYVIAASTSATPVHLSSWFVREKANSMGHYRITDGSIAFTDVSKEGAIDYESEVP